VSSLLGEQLLGYLLTGEIPERCGNAHPSAAPHNVYRAWGTDRWLAIEVHDDDVFAALARVIGRPGLAQDPRFRDAPARKHNERELDRIIEEWTRQRDRDWMLGELQRAGVTAAPSRDARDLWADRHLRERGAFAAVDHPFRMSAHALPAERAPLLGEHTEPVLQRVLGLSERELEELRAAGTIR
jgi:crotonobetainyl-CoA:carnitine CoA-transferase CaiB-like acyl-CoA transferase